MPFPTISLYIGISIVGQGIVGIMVRHFTFLVDSSRERYITVN